VDINKIIARAKAVLLTPKTEWPVIAGETADTKSIFINYAVPLAALPAIATFLKLSVFGIGVLFLGNYRMPMSAGLSSAIFNYGASLLGVFLLALLINALAPSFGGTKDSTQALKTATYSYTAAWLGGVGIVVPGVGWLLAIAGGIYSIYLLYTGLPHTMKAPADKTTGYTVVVVVAAIVLALIVGSLTGGMRGRAALGGMGAGGMFGSLGSSGDNTGNFDNGSLGGALQGLAKSAESASKQMEAAQKSGDANAQVAAAGNAVAAVLGGGATVEALPTDRMKGFLPATLAGLKQIESSASRNGALGMQVSEAKARYGTDDGRGVELEITDMGSAKGLMGLASWVNVEEDTQTQTGYEKTYKQGENMIHEEWDSQSKNGEYSVVLAQRFVVKISGAANSAEQLKSYIAGVDLAGLAALRNEGVKSN
jgi:hypothetical protein